jgi:nitric oxide dioxygenase
MNDLKMLLVKSSWSYAASDPEEAGMLFYGKLFEIDPSLRHMFGQNMEGQAKKLIQMVTFIIARLQTLDDLREELASLGRRHVHYGTRPEHYKTVGQALLWTLSELLEDRWDAPTQEAWTEVYNLLSGAMIEAGRVVTP